jgi:hypothetical protein
VPTDAGWVVSWEAPMLKWTIEIEVDEKWVADGFNLSKPRQLQALEEQILQWAYGHEKRVTLVSGPDPAKVAELQGYPSVAAMETDG